MIIGVLGGGQLGRMLALAGYPLGLNFRFLEPSPEAPVGILAEQRIGSYDDAKTLDEFAEGLDLVTYEFESIPIEAVRRLEKRVAVFPPSAALEAAQDRMHEKTLFQRLGIQTAAFVGVNSEADLRKGVEKIGLPAVLKTCRLGYDGKGQMVLRQPDDMGRAWKALGGVPLILESFVPFQRELSVLGVRGQDGAAAFYPLVENHHREGILRLSLAPAAGHGRELQDLAEDYAQRIFRALEYVGVLAIELFQQDGKLLANEMAPRVHNSGHWTIEGADTSQFENHLRAIMNLPLGATLAIGQVAMLNLIGTVPEVADLFSVPGTHVHLYGKQPRPGRKLGHVTVCAHDRPELESRLARLRPLVRLAE